MVDLSASRPNITLSSNEVKESHVCVFGSYQGASCEGVVPNSCAAPKPFMRAEREAAASVDAKMQASVFFMRQNISDNAAFGKDFFPFSVDRGGHVHKIRRTIKKAESEIKR